MTKRIRPSVMAATIVVALGGCWSDDNDSRSATAGLPTLRQDLEANEWVLDRADSSLTVDDTAPVTLGIAGDAVSGSGPCNVYRGEFDLDGDEVEITDLVTTRRACEASTMEAEAEFLAALESSTRVGLDDDRLVLSDGGRLVFDPFDTDEAIAGAWSVVDTAVDDGIVSVLPGSAPTLTFDADDTLVLTTGCNTASGSWALDGDRLTVDPMRVTLKHCDDPAGVMEQEAALIAAVESSDRVELAPDGLTLLDDQGLIVLLAKREATTD